MSLILEWVLLWDALMYDEMDHTLILISLHVCLLYVTFGHQLP